MLMAAPSAGAGELDLLRLALQLVEDGDEYNRDELAAYFASVVAQAIALSAQAPARTGNLSPAAIQLALAIKKDSTLADDLRNTPDLNVLSRERARQIRTSIENQLAA